MYSLSWRAAPRAQLSEGVCLEEEDVRRREPCESSVYMKGKRYVSRALGEAAYRV